NPRQKDIVFFGAPVVILLAGDNPIDAGLAASNMELVACAGGLGVLYSGFITTGSNDEKIKTLIGLPAGKEVLTALVVGYPDVRYLRSAPRKKADILWA
ncbi:MAG: nitroreductase, partial [Clostridiales bacterium]|nr:nitroreductase [Clostridiales bacterium]